MSFPIDGYSVTSMTAQVSVYDSEFNGDSIRISFPELSGTDSQYAMTQAAINGVKDYLEAQFPTGTYAVGIQYQSQIVG